MSVNTYLNERERRILESAVVGIAGAGGLGSNCAMHLVRAGVKKLVIADFDVVGESNLNRQFFFRDQLGRKKVDALGENLRRIEPDLSLDLRDVRLAPDNIDWTFSGCSVTSMSATITSEGFGCSLRSTSPLFTDMCRSVESRRSPKSPPKRRSAESVN